MFHIHFSFIFNICNIIFVYKKFFNFIKIWKFLQGYIIYVCELHDIFMSHLLQCCFSQCFACKSLSRPFDSYNHHVSIYFFMSRKNINNSHMRAYLLWIYNLWRNAALRDNVSSYDCTRCNTNTCIDHFTSANYQCNIFSLAFIKTGLHNIRRTSKGVHGKSHLPYHDAYSW